MDETYRKLLERYAKETANGNPLAEDFIKERRSVENKALQARDLAEDALANQVMKNTNVPIPGKEASRAKQENFLNRILEQTHPEISPDVRLSDDIPDYDGAYNSNTGIIKVNASTAKKDILKGLSATLHEGAHKYDFDTGGFKGTPDIEYKDLVKNTPNGRMLKDIDPAHAYELMSNGHHKQLPDLRNGSFGLGALKSMMKNGTFRQVAGALPLAGTALALSSGDVSAAASELPSEIPILGQAYDAIRPEAAGSAMDDREMKNEVKALDNYSNSQARKDALKKIGQR